MIAETPQALVLSLIATTLLGIVMGYCIALIRAKRASAAVVDNVRAELLKENSATETDLRTTRVSIENLRSLLNDSKTRALSSMKREESLKVHSEQQTQRIDTLEAHLSSYEDQQIRLKRDFANYKSNMTRELEQSKAESRLSSGASQFPVLSKRIIDDNRQTSDADEVARVAAVEGASASSQARNAPRGENGLRAPLSRELEIPSLSESELPNSEDELEFEMADLDSTGRWPRG